MVSIGAIERKKLRIYANVGLERSIGSADFKWVQTCVDMEGWLCHENDVGF